ncbi:DgyrCDS4104 [Dimorphilus gyrociliatus]|uniref:DgyrCDS4104 n=1 Tax=Dimorphilus gyrociliatus TaxID=2664684 RepID=A0A7I8VKI7_9ANNE|nr:DgyrCDS4104 [Dimorphilus gyrociliatus]
MAFYSRRYFQLHLRRKQLPLDRKFKVIEVDAQNNHRTADVFRDTVMYEGYVIGEPYTSHVSAYWESDKELMASIRSKQDTFVIEPSWRHEASPNSTMLTYRASDIDKLPKEKHFCAFVNPYKEDGNGLNDKTGYHKTKQNTKRIKRDEKSNANIIKKKRCSIYLVADYKFTKEMGNNDVKITTWYLIGLLERVDNIYRNTDFGDGYNGMGFSIKEIVVHTAPTNEFSHYNSIPRTKWQTKDLLKSFSRQDKLRNFCLGHLFTYTSFDTGVLGLAYIASPRRYSAGGICTTAYGSAWLNTGWSSSVNRYGKKLLAQEADIVTAHEFGHNWGSEHDPDNTECSPKNYGKYIMHTYAVSGYEKNNQIFSPCSKRSIKNVLIQKHSRCFTEPSQAYCGNSLVEEGEECDPGLLTTDNCCSATCKLKEGAKCSPLNHGCCTEDCKIKAEGKICIEEQPTRCQGNSKCDGIAPTCPKPGPANNNMACGAEQEMSKCRNGECIAFCETVNKVSCQCEEAENVCNWCCKDSKSAPCKPYYFAGNKTRHLRDGRPCLTGLCWQGVCKKPESDFERFWNIIDNLHPSRIGL